VPRGAGQLAGGDVVPGGGGEQPGLAVGVGLRGVQAVVQQQHGWGEQQGQRGLGGQGERGGHADTGGGGIGEAGGSAPGPRGRFPGRATADREECADREVDGGGERDPRGGDPPAPYTDVGEAIVGAGQDGGGGVAGEHGPADTRCARGGGHRRGRPGAGGRGNRAGVVPAPVVPAVVRARCSVAAWAASWMRQGQVFRPACPPSVQRRQWPVPSSRCWPRMVAGRPGSDSRNLINSRVMSGGPVGGGMDPGSRLRAWARSFRG
jgi:hypothetical protein